MSVLFNEKQADQEVIKALLNELKKRSTMSKLFKLADGRIIRAIEFEEVTIEEIQAEANHFKQELAAVEELLPSDEPAAPAPPSENQQIQDQPQPPAAPVAPTVPAADESVQTPAPIQ